MFLQNRSVLGANGKYSGTFLKGWANPSHFFFIFVFSTVQLVEIFFAYVWIRTADLWCRKRPPYQLSHNHCPKILRILNNANNCKRPVPYWQTTWVEYIWCDNGWVIWRRIFPPLAFELHTMTGTFTANLRP